MANDSRVRRALAYVCVPASFCAIGYLILWLALQPVWGLASAAFSLLVSDEATSFNSNLSESYDPEAHKSFEGGDYIDAADIEYPNSGERYGQLECARIGLDAPLYWYDSDEILAYGVGQSLASFPPGFGRVIILSGHNTTYFKCLESIEAGDVVTVTTNYGKYEYAVSKVEVYDENDLEVLLAHKGREENEELIMYACYPFHAITGRKTQRIVAFADKTSGPEVRWKESDNG